EWKPRSLIPVALASAVAAVVRRYVLGFGPLFPVPAHPLFIGPKGLLGCALVGLLAGVLSALLTVSVYAAEDAFQRLAASAVARDGPLATNVKSPPGCSRSIRRQPLSA